MTPAQRIIIEVARDHYIDPALVTSLRRTDAVVRVRAEVARRLDARGYTTNQIGMALKRDHATVIYYLGRRGKKLSPEKNKVSRPSWRAPMIADLGPRPIRRCLVPYAGAEFKAGKGGYTWKPYEREQASP